MGEVTSRAQLIDASSFGARSQVAATLPRGEIEEALRLEEPPELVLDISRRSNGDVKAHTLRVAWTEGQLQELLRDTSEGEAITLYFDADEVEQALADEDVEAHGMREKTAAILTVATVAAGIGAAAQPASAQAASSGTIEMVSDAASSGVPADAAGASGTGYVVPAGGNEAIVNDAGAAGASGTGYVIPAGGNEAIVNDAGVAGASGTGYVVPAGSNEAIVNDAGVAGASGTGYVVPAGSNEAIVSDAVGADVASGPELISDAASGPGVDVVRSSGPELISDAASGPGVDVRSTGPELISDAASTGTLSPAQSTDLASAVSVAGDDSAMSTSEIAGAAVGGAMVLLITAAGFAVRGKRRHELPA
jgi:hypothetical protein